MENGNGGGDARPVMIQVIYLKTEEWRTHAAMKRLSGENPYSTRNPDEDCEF